MLSVIHTTAYSVLPLRKIGSSNSFNVVNFLHTSNFVLYSLSSISFSSVDVDTKGAAGRAAGRAAGGAAGGAREGGESGTRAG